MPPHTKSATVIYVRGLPGSGKTHLALALQQALGQNVLLLDPDAIDFDSETYKNHIQNQIEEQVDEALWPYRFLRAQAYQGIEDGKTIIWNQPFSNLDIFRRAVSRLKDHAAEHGLSLSILLIEVEVNPATAKQRVVTRKAQGGHGPSDERFDRFVSEYQSFAGEGYPTITVDGEDDTETSLTSILQALNNLV